MTITMWRLLSASVFISLLPLSIAEDSKIYNVVPQHQFSEGDLHYHTLLFDQPNMALYVGAMNYVYRLWQYNINDTSSKASYSRQHLPARQEDTRKCSYQVPPAALSYECQNHVRALLKTPDNELLVCGTNSYTPRLYRLKSDSLSITSESLGLAICGLSPTDNTTAVFAESGNPFPGPSIYAGAVTDRALTSAVIYRPENGQTSYMTTIKSDSKWLNGPQFVGSFDLGDQFIYYFFREPAIEYTNCGKAIYSRVARVCKNDVGGKHVLKNTWSTFVKARLNCSIPGEFPFYFDQIQSVDHIQVEGRTFFYATFTTTSSGFSGSAVCVYLLDDVNRVFDHGAFKTQDTSLHQWVPVMAHELPPSRPGQCVSDSKSVSDGTLNFIKSHPMLDEAVQGVTPTPLFYKRDVLLTQIGVDCGLAQDQRRCVAFAADTSGRLYKLSHNHADMSAQNTLLATYQLPEHSRVNAMKIWHNEFLYIAQSSAISQLPVDQCSHYRLCSACTQDPYCSWDSQTAKCGRALEKHSLDSRYLRLDSSQCSLRVEKHSRILYPGDAAHFDCSAASSVGQKAFWRFNGVRVAPANGRHLLTADSGLVIINASSADSGTFECFAHNTLLVKYKVHVDDVNCQRPGNAQAYYTVYREWCREFQNYKQTMMQWREWYEENSQCINSAGYTKIAGSRPSKNKDMRYSTAENGVVEISS